MVIERRPTSLLNSEELSKRVEEAIIPLDSKVKFEEVNLNKCNRTMVRFRNEEHLEREKQTLQTIEEEAELRRLNARKSIKIIGVPKRVIRQAIETEEFKNRIRITTEFGIPNTYHLFSIGSEAESSARYRQETEDNLP